MFKYSKLPSTHVPPPPFLAPTLHPQRTRFTWLVTNRALRQWRRQAKLYPHLVATTAIAAAQLAPAGPPLLFLAAMSASARPPLIPFVAALSAPGGRTVLPHATRSAPAGPPPSRRPVSTRWTHCPPSCRPVSTCWTSPTTSCPACSPPCRGPPAAPVCRAFLRLHATVRLRWPVRFMHPSNGDLGALRTLHAASAAATAGAISMAASSTSYHPATASIAATTATVEGPFVSHDGPATHDE